MTLPPALRWLLPRVTPHGRALDVLPTGTGTVYLPLLAPQDPRFTHRGFSSMTPVTRYDLGLRWDTGCTTRLFGYHHLPPFRRLWLIPQNVRRLRTLFAAPHTTSPHATYQLDILAVAHFRTDIPLR